MKYIFINPVVANMYAKKELDAVLLQNGYHRMEVLTDWHKVVKEKYDKLRKQTKKTILDKRCPKAMETILPYVHDEKALIPDIHPILIHCGIELANRKEYQGYEKIITTPCQSLADYGNAIGLEDTTFISWKEFLKQLHIENALQVKLLKDSPIPPGYFQGLNAKVTSISGKDDIVNYFKNDCYTQDTFVEMLYCHNGCHNGDGVCIDE